MNSLSALTYSVVALTLVACGDGMNDELQDGLDARRGDQNQGTGADQDDAGRKDSDRSPILDGEDAGDRTSGDASDAGSDSAPDDGLDDFSRKVLARAKEWVAVKMPYCGGINHGTDYLCGGTCERSGIHASTAWDPYRTDCSGFVSWAWSLPSPGRVTGEFAPFNLAVTTAISVDDLLPGDALNNDGHIILFGGWANPQHTKARLLEEYDCGQVAVDRIRDISKVSDKQVTVPNGTFTAIRLDSRGP